MTGEKKKAHSPGARIAVHDPVGAEGGGGRHARSNPMSQFNSEAGLQFYTTQLGGDRAAVEAGQRMQHMAAAPTPNPLTGELPIVEDTIVCEDKSGRKVHFESGPTCSESQSTNTEH
ncbi:uncharacterized protein SPPG_04523 [Spizellomyces punctatus DAOM BR117]|uniref:Uncharacterized protein n=1 Tax=Spizellomyces punctatus (strain DAOM BR117) TaxID=645134 RepID=A0A0L0HGL7_SPIPD|nr:uncharacterized protein SPPG_04523 [Spizellomyces punctatus DAOM BR117]KND00182.1 hypothetical protein SPPG_04523 [Spizellomyces punctatus DAOM BR117]|eukprot:XP_016608221.1 hypothetical protein SPPG_04523 [Spizellomyces punctatus DAOM BR117]